MDSVIVRSATPDDLPAITYIYNQAILTTTATFDIEPKTPEEQRRWFEGHDDRHPVIVAVEGDIVVGWAALSRYSDRKAYDGIMAEIAVYVEESCRGGGIGRRLAEAIVEAGRDVGLHTLLSRIAEENEASIRLTESLGFTHIGVMKEAGMKFGRLIGVVMMQYIYPNLEQDYRVMATDEARERETLEWSESNITDSDNAAG